MAVRPFPYASLPKLSRRQRHLQGALRACWAAGQIEHALTAARGLLGREITAELGVTDALSKEELAARCATAAGLGVLIEQAEQARPIALELTHEAAQQLVDLALGGDASELRAPSLVPLDELSRGALAYVVARVLAALGGGWTLREIVELSQLQAALPALLGSSVVCPIALQLGALQLHVHAYIPERLTPDSVPERPAIRELHELRVSLLASAGFVTLPLTSIRALSLRDVIVLDDSRLVRERDGWRGEVSAGVVGSRHQLQCTIFEDGLRVQGYICAKEHGMSTGHVDREAAEQADSAAKSLAQDAPIELQVEIARFSLSLGELQRLQAGDVLVTGRRIGQRVSVRIGQASQAFAEGELVDVEGEVGVRLLCFHEPAGSALPG